MAETTAEVRRDIELTRERMSTTLQELEHRMNLMQVVKDNPWPSLAVAFGAGLVLSNSSADVKAAEATRGAARSAGGRVGPMLDGLVADLVGALTAAFESRVDTLVGEIRHAVGGNSTPPPNVNRPSYVNPSIDSPNAGQVARGD
jgi:hypothetical protein